MTPRAAAFPATVTAASPLRIRPRGSTQDAPARAVSGYVPVIGDQVSYLVYDTHQLLVFGIVAPGDDGGGGVVNDEYAWSSHGDLQVESPVPLKYYNDTGVDLTVVRIRAALGSASSGADIILNVIRDGATALFTAGLTIAAGSLTVVQVPDVVTWDDGSYLEVSVDQVGSVLPGANLVLTVVARS